MNPKNKPNTLGCPLLAWIPKWVLDRRVESRLGTPLNTTPCWSENNGLLSLLWPWLVYHQRGCTNIWLLLTLISRVSFEGSESHLGSLFSWASIQSELTWRQHTIENRVPGGSSSSVSHIVWWMWRVLKKKNHLGFHFFFFDKISKGGWMNILNFGSHQRLSYVHEWTRKERLDWREPKVFLNSYLFNAIDEKEDLWTRWMCQSHHKNQDWMSCWGW